MMRLSLLFVSFFLLPPSAAAERYTFDLSSPSRASLTLEQGIGSSSSSITRQIQSSANDEPCFVDGAFLICQYSFAAGERTNETMIYFTAQCDFSAASGYDYRRSSNCGCIANVVPKFSPAKECPCSICAAGFGETPVSVDCGEYDTTAQSRESGSATVPAVAVSNATNVSVVDPYIFSTCTSIDCSGACNGTCAINCDASGEICPYCENYDGEGAPTGAPVGSGDGSLTNFGESAAALVMTRSFALIMASITLSLFL